MPGHVKLPFVLMLVHSVHFLCVFVCQIQVSAQNLVTYAELQDFAAH